MLLSNSSFFDFLSGIYARKYKKIRGMLENNLRKIKFVLTIFR